MTTPLTFFSAPSFWYGRGISQTRREKKANVAGIAFPLDPVRTLVVADRSTFRLGSLFASLRTLEEAHVQVIRCRTFPTHDLGLAIRDRLGRTAGGRIIQV